MAGDKANKDTGVFLTHILESIELIEIYVKDMDKQAFLSDIEAQDASMRRLEIIGEACKNIPADFRKSHPVIPWKKIAGLRDVLIHEYFGADLGLVWSVIHNRIPELRSEIQKIVASGK